MRIPSSSLGGVKNCVVCGVCAGRIKPALLPSPRVGEERGEEEADEKELGLYIDDCLSGRAYAAEKLTGLKRPLAECW